MKARWDPTYVLSDLGGKNSLILLVEFFDLPTDTNGTIKYTLVILCFVRHSF